MTTWYRYKPGSRPEEVAQVFERSQLWCAIADQLNDPFEMRPSFTWSRDGAMTPQERKRMIERHIPGASYDEKLEQRRIAKQKFADPEVRAAFRNRCEQELAASMRQSSICCFCREYDDILLWALYANGHRGFCIGIDFNVPWRMYYAPRNQVVRLFPTDVHYRREYPTVDLDADMLDPDVAANLTRSVLLSKSDHWGFEREGRIVLLGEPAGFQAYPPAALRSVHLGACIDADLRQQIVDVVRLRNPRPDVLQCALPKDRYGLDVERIELG